MICTVSTVLDSVENILDFRDKNVMRGVDHVFVFLDDGSKEKARLINKSERITAVACSDDYWENKKPENLNYRQAYNATLMNRALSCIGGRSWIFHIDSDEVLYIDKEELLAEKKRRYVKLKTWEAVSDGVKGAFVEKVERLVVPFNGFLKKPGSDLFKVKLSDIDLQLLHYLGEIDEPKNTSYFKGHLSGKCGVVASKDLVFKIHIAKRLSDGKEPLVSHGFYHPFAVLHYDMPNFSTFLEKWERHIEHAGIAGYRDKRGFIKYAVSLLNKGKYKSSFEKRGVLKKIYREIIEDNIVVLNAFGYLREPKAPSDFKYERFSEDDIDLVNFYINSVDKEKLFRDLDSVW